MRMNAQVRRAVAEVQGRLHLVIPAITIEDGLQAALFSAMRRRLRRDQLAARQQSSEPEVVQLVLRLQPPKDRKNSRASYPMVMVLEARKMRKWEFTYKEIADALNEHFKTNVSWITIRDWVQQHYRMLK